jgi:hypothetical protein
MLSFIQNESNVARSLGWVAVTGSGGDRGAFTFCGGNFLNNQILKAKGRTQGYNKIYPVWPRNDAFPQLLLSNNAFIYTNMQSDSCDFKNST